MLHGVTKPTHWRGCSVMFKTAEEDAAYGARIGAKLVEWHGQKQVGRRVKE